MTSSSVGLFLCVALDTQSWWDACAVIVSLAAGGAPGLSGLGQGGSRGCAVLQAGRERRGAGLAEEQAGPGGPGEEGLGRTRGFPETWRLHGAAGCVSGVEWEGGPVGAARGGGRRVSAPVPPPQAPWGPASTRAARPGSARPTGCGTRPWRRSGACAASSPLQVGSAPASRTPGSPSTGTPAENVTLPTFKVVLSDVVHEQLFPSYSPALRLQIPLLTKMHS